MREKGPQAEGAASAKALRLDLFMVQSMRKGEGCKMRLKRKQKAVNRASRPSKKNLHI